MNKRGRHIPGFILICIFIIMSFGFLYIIWNTNMIPTVPLVILAAFLIILILFYGFLVWNIQHLIRFAAGTLLVVVTGTALFFGGSYIHQTTNTLDKISGVNVEKSQISVYVKDDNIAEELSDTRNYKYGILQSLDRPTTDNAVAMLNSELETKLETIEYPGLSQLVDAVLRGEIDAILLNQAYWDILEELGYNRQTTPLRDIGNRVIKTTIEPIKTNDATTTSSKSHSTFKKEQIYTIFISGIDSRNGMISKSRSDVNIIAIVNTETHQILLVSTPRDFFIPLSISNGVPDKLTHAGIYGINVCMDTLSQLYDIDINNYFRINFDGFINIINALGGITVHSDYNFSSENINGYHFVQGENHVNGEQALVFARERYAFEEGDRQRGRNQMAVIKGVIQKVLSPELLKNYSSLLKAVEGSFETNITYEEIAFQLQKQLKKGGDWNIIPYSVNGTGDTQKPYSMSQAAYVMIPDVATVEKAKELIKKVTNGKTITTEDTIILQATPTTTEVPIDESSETTPTT